jgi:hypothetical protein
MDKKKRPLPDALKFFAQHTPEGSFQWLAALLDKFLQRLIDQGLITPSAHCIHFISKPIYYNPNHPRKDFVRLATSVGFNLPTRFKTRWVCTV